MSADESLEHEDISVPSESDPDSLEIAQPVEQAGFDLSRFVNTLAAQQAFRIDPKILRDLSSISALTSIPAFTPPNVDWAKLIAPSLDTNAQLAKLAANLRPPEWSPEFLRTFELTRRSILSSVSVASLYSPSPSGDAALRASPPRQLRLDRSPEDFFNQVAVEITSVQQLLKTLATLQSKQARHRPIWRGQSNAHWAVHSSLYRRIGTNAVSEDVLVAAEVEGLERAREWDISTTQSLRYFADLQHNGAPTRLMDVTTDPEIAAWFAVEDDPEHEVDDGLIVGWGRVPVLRAGISSVTDDRIEDAPLPFWHSWISDEERQRVDWGTGTKTWTWFPPALNERMRAQRAGFLFEAGALLTDAVVDVFSQAMDLDWRMAEITRATSVVGLPSRHDVLTKPNEANLVPMFVLRIAANAKPTVREYLKGKGLMTSSVYPDMQGLVSFLKSSSGPGQ